MDRDEDFDEESSEGSAKPGTPIEPFRTGELAVDEGATHASFKLRLDDKALGGASQLAFVHYHPVRRVVDDVLVPLYRAMRDSSQVSLDDFWWTIRREEYLFRVPPSLADFKADALLRRELEGRLRAGTVIRSFVVTALTTVSQ